ncbi:hypothetical protein H257_17956 [Aphanomyces astaci]|uniref:Uncharacterized protein n=1 Tax=Aphanomyces astaci TaxID=112090 RepID=W4FEJ3_APHAT|nr:hypothetical protein H257_17956 [Aphanomyces astaci]ETV65309.1 hypothetical protein H257_17956 [Aphanomyces astaci]|eukprot:XP_009845235.1 hypothetical protein H257_17956 [Aphanomyces astaci]
MVARILWNIDVSVLQRATHPTKHSLNDARVGLLDLGLAPHINNAAVAANMELAQWHAACRLLQTGFTHKWSVLAGSNMIWYRREIPPPPLTAYSIHSQVVYWDDTWFFFCHRFECPVTDTFFAEGRSPPHGRLAQVLAQLGLDGTQKTLPMPDIVTGYLAWDAATKAAMESNEDDRHARAKLA